jgi:hypothetical protein
VKKIITGAEGTDHRVIIKPDERSFGGFVFIVGVVVFHTKDTKIFE